MPCFPSAAYRIDRSEGWWIDHSAVYPGIVSDSQKEDSGSFALENDHAVVDGRFVGVRRRIS